MRELSTIKGKTYKTSQFINRDIAWLDFNYRVLNEAIDSRTPLLERLKFIDIYRSNNDEFFMKRMGSILGKVEQNSKKPLIDGHSYEELYKVLQRKESPKKLVSNFFSRDFTSELDWLPFIGAI